MEFSSRPIALQWRDHFDKSPVCRAAHRRFLPSAEARTAILFGIGKRLVENNYAIDDEGGITYGSRRWHPQKYRDGFFSRTRQVCSGDHRAEFTPFPE